MSNFELQKKKKIGNIFGNIPNNKRILPISVFKNSKFMLDVK